MGKFSKAMASFMKRFKKKRRLSTELHDRWGDPAISYPNEGSWNQWNQTSGFVANASIEPPRHLQPDHSRHYGSPPLQPLQNQDWDGFNPHAIQQNHPPESIQKGSNFPKGYFDANIRRPVVKTSTLRPPFPGLGIDGTQHDIRREIPDIDSMDDPAADESCDEDDDEEDEERDTLGDSRCLALRGCATEDTVPRHVVRDDCDSFDRAAKSPALSITSRMRRVSIQSSTTQASSVAGSSRRTSYTAASSVSAPSLPPDTPRYPPQAISHAMKMAQAEKRPPVPRRKTREPEPTPPTRQEMVPSYDDLFG
ncbi:hypothetical protein N7466_004805 [Penicillium verhagenii]|uniref:uncharacterized protein n=1 Tax=Penicillium verhagenii TaxID=1562060 RepID=UPI002545A86A|nr:uncharacterized protein N7466_004805 [Penicillium verhagenii]KAJ5935258.1 hypothetical protein N7466_004805 [Penicillium verhagenii]